MQSYWSYKKDLIRRFWEYQNEKFPVWEEYFEHPYTQNVRPPVFTKKSAEHNVLIEPGIPSELEQQLMSMIPVYERHRWFRSMTSSQAIALSIFGNLKVNGCLDYLYDLRDDDGTPLFENATLPDNFHMEYSVNYLGEPRSTNLDGFVSGDYQVAIECKLSEAEVGTCSRPRLSKKNTNFKTDFCDGSYSYQNGRQSRCSLTERDIKYWHYMPDLFSWTGDTDYNPCPLRMNYQLVRNILAACIRPDGTLRPEKGHVVLIYDERNPSFIDGGDGYKAFIDTKKALHDKGLLKRCSWQDIANYLRKKDKLNWLTAQLHLKYGI